jgi:hypothetical protein
MKKLFPLLFLFTLTSLILNPVSFADDGGQTKYQNTTVSAIVGPQVGDFQFAMGYEGSSLVHQDSTITYNITYGASSSASLTTANTIVAHYSTDRAPDNTFIVDYVPGSATNAYNDSVPVVDLINRTITWTIPALPPGTVDQTATFKLHINTNYDGPLRLTYRSYAQMTNTYVTMPQQNVQQDYQFDRSLIVPGPTATPGPQPTPVVTPTPIPAPVYIVSISDISDNNASVSITSAYPAKLSISYGTAPPNLAKTISSNDYQYQHFITLSDLVANTHYYFRFTLTYPSGRTVTSEIFTFRTAKKSLLPTADNNIIVFTANGTIYFSRTQNQAVSSNPLVILTDNLNYQIAYTFTKPIQLKSIATVVLNKILASNTLAAIQLPTALVIPMQKTVQNLYVANGQTPNSGLYELYVRITDTNGNIVQKKIANLKVMPRFTVYAQDTGRPLQDARVSLYYFDTKTNQYLPLSQELFGAFSNPNYTNATGQIPIILPAGRYRVEESALLYNKVSKDFTIGAGINQNYPVIYLQRDPLNFTSLITFTKDYLTDSWNKAAATLQDFSSSIRLFHLFAVAILASFVIINFLLFSLRGQIKAHHLPVYFIFHIDKMLNRHKEKYLYGSVLDEENRPVSQVLIEIEDRDTQNILMETSTTKAGKFYIRNTFSGEINLLLTKEGYEVTSIPLNPLALPDTGLTLNLNHGTHHHHSATAHVKEGISESIGVLFETSLIITLILEFLFFSIYGFAKTTPYLVLSMVNILLWLFYVHEHSQKKEL